MLTIWNSSFLVFVVFFLPCTSNANQTSIGEPTEQELFVWAYQNNVWLSKESRSGIGAELSHTAVIRTELPLVLQELSTKTLLDVACGDLNWLKEIDLTSLEHYIGLDVVPELIERNRNLYGSSKCRFICANAIADPLPYADVVLCRSLLPLLSYDNIFKVINNIKKSGAQYLITSHYPMKKTNTELPKELRTIMWVRPINLELDPFNFPEPLVIIYEGESGPIAFDKSIALWDLNDIPLYIEPKNIT